MDFNDYQRESLKTWKVNHKNDFFRAILGLCEEAGEVAGKLKKSYRDDVELEPDVMAKELGDCLYYLTRVGEYFNLTLEDIAKMNIDKLKDRQERGVIGGSGDSR